MYVKSHWNSAVLWDSKKSLRTPLSWSVVLLWETQRQMKDIFSNLPGSRCEMKDFFFFFSHWIIASINTMASTVRTESNMQHSPHAFHHPWFFQCILFQPLIKDHCYYTINFFLVFWVNDLTTVTKKGSFWLKVFTCMWHVPHWVSLAHFGISWWSNTDFYRQLTTWNISLFIFLVQPCETSLLGY